MSQAPSSELTEIIERSLQTANTQLNNFQFINDDLQKFKARTLTVGPRSALPLINELKDSLSKTSYASVWPFFYLFIAYVYFILNDLHAARIMAEDAVRKFANDDWNLALARWFLAVILREDGYNKDAKEQLAYSLKTFTKIYYQTANSDVGWRIKRNCSLVMEAVKRADANLPTDDTRLFESSRRTQKEKFFSGNEESLSTLTSQYPQSMLASSNSDAGGNAGTINRQTRQDVSSRGPNDWDEGNGLQPPSGRDNNNGGEKPEAHDDGLGKRPDPTMSLHINIPIDIRSTDHIDQTSLPYLHSQPELNSRIETPIEANFINVESFVSPPLGEMKQHISENENGIPIDVPHIGYLATPSLPIYGSASAGPRGDIMLDEPNYNAAIDESAFVRIDKGEYEIHSVRNDKRAVNISYTDFLTSITPRKNRRNDGKTYGLLKVTGNSMNKTEPVTIDEHDYVLFIELKDRTLTANKGKVVVVSQSIGGSIRLLLKRLVWDNDQWLLRSYSRGNDPDTELPYEDLLFDDCYRLIGEVIAVAKLHSSDEI